MALLLVLMVMIESVVVTVEWSAEEDGADED